jgi:hypothetical protein
MENTTMSNSSRIEVATRKHVGATLTSQMIMELVKLSDPTNTKGVYPSDCAYKRTPDGLVPRGKVAYGDGVLEYLAENSFKVLADNEIVRRPSSRKAPAAAPVATPAVAAAPVKAETKPVVTDKKKSAKSIKPPVAPKQKGAVRQQVQ